VLPFLDRIVRGSAPKPADAGAGDPDASEANAPQPSASDTFTHVLGLRWVVRTRAERDELYVVEEAIRAAGLTDVVLDKIEPGKHELAFWLHTSNPKRAFKQLAKLPPIAAHMSGLQAAYADRVKLKFSPLWPKGRHASIPHGLG
jgi:hypothetical protein